MLAKRKTADGRAILQEILSKPSNEKRPLNEQEFAELRIDDFIDSSRSGFAVTEWRIRWGEIDQHFVWENEQSEHWDALQTARNRYEARLRSLKEQGFVTSDMDF